ncbi:tetratricopeptide repeat protein [bacterium]|nr:tetratricopeptide repeat protein [bacterium]
MNVNNQQISAEEFSSTADIYFSENKNQEAIQCYLHSIFLKRVNPQAYKGLGKAYRSLKKFDKAIISLEKAKNADSFDAEIYSELGICYLAKGEFHLAMKNLIQSIKLAPNNTDTQIQLAVAHEIIGEEDMAVQIYQKIMETNPDCEKAYIQKATLLIQLELYSDAICVFKDILELNKKYYRSYLGIAICLDKLGETQRAKRYYKKYLKFMPDGVNKNNVIKRLANIPNFETKHNNFLKIVE